MPVILQALCSLCFKLRNNKELNWNWIYNWTNILYSWPQTLVVLSVMPSQPLLALCDDECSYSHQFWWWCIKDTYHRSCSIAPGCCPHMLSCPYHSHPKVVAIDLVSSGWLLPPCLHMGKNDKRTQLFLEGTVGSSSVLILGQWTYQCVLMQCYNNRGCLCISDYNGHIRVYWCNLTIIEAGYVLVNLLTEWFRIFAHVSSTVTYLIGYPD